MIFFLPICYSHIKLRPPHYCWGHPTKVEAMLKATPLLLQRLNKKSSLINKIPSITYFAMQRLTWHQKKKIIQLFNCKFHLCQTIKSWGGKTPYSVKIEVIRWGAPQVEILRAMPLNSDRSAAQHLNQFQINTYPCDYLETFQYAYMPNSLWPIPATIQGQFPMTSATWI